MMAFQTIVEGPPCASLAPAILAGRFWCVTPCVQVSDRIMISEGLRWQEKDPY